MKKTIFVLLINIFLFKGFAQTGFSEKQIIDDVSLYSTFWVSTADIDRDGAQDIVVALSGNNTIAWYKNIDNSGSFEPKIIVTNALNYTDYVSTSDINQDGDIDILSLSPSDQIVWFENLDGNGTFSNKNIINNTQDVPRTVIGSDIDGDGDNDVIACSRYDNTIAWYENVGGQGNFSGMNIITSTADTAIGMDVADIDGDGDMDVVSDSSSIVNTPSWYRNMNGEGTFGGEHIIVSENYGLMLVKLADINNDGANDIVSMEFGGNTIAWFENLNGTGTFATKQIISTDVTHPIQVEIGDIDNDGNKDIVSVSTVDNKVAWYKNDGTGNFGSQIIIDDAFIKGRGLSLSDIDNDGYIDIVASNVDPDTRSLVWYKNLTYLGIEDQPLQVLSLYPNPAINVLQINNPNNVVIKQVQVYNLLGKEVLQMQDNNNTINVSGLLPGVYLVKLITQEGVRSFKMVKK